MKPAPLRSGLAIIALVMLMAGGWWYFAPTNIGGSTAYVATHGPSMQPRFHTGDLAIVRPSSSYQVGQIVAYHSRLLNTTVLHRVIAVHGKQYVFKGDSNKFIDPVPVPRADLLGKLWLRVPHGGIILSALHTPFVAAVIASLLAIFGLYGLSEARKRRTRRQRRGSEAGRRGIPLVNDSRHHDETRLINYGACLAASAGLAALFATLALVVFVCPVAKPSARVTPYTQQVSFGYSAHTRPGPVYPNGKIATGDPIFLSLVRGVDLHITYSLTSKAPVNVSGTEKVVLKLSGPSGWHRSFVLVPQTHFTSGHADTDIALNLAQLQALQAKIQRLTASDGGFSTAIGPQVKVAGTVDGRPVSTSFNPALSFQFVGGQLQISGGQSAPGSASGTSASASSAMFAPKQTATVSTPATAPNTLTVLGVSPRIDLLRWIAIVGLVLSGIATFYFYLRKRGEPFEETFRIQAHYGYMMVSIVAGEDLGWPAVDVASIKALAKLAESGQRLILHSRSGGVDTYLVNDEGTVYRYQVKPSKVLWGDWSKPDEPLEEAA